MLVLLHSAHLLSQGQHPDHKSSMRLPISFSFDSKVGTLGHTGHGGENDRGSNDHMPSLGERPILEEILFNDFSTDVILQRNYTSASLGECEKGSYW